MPCGFATGIATAVTKPERFLRTMLIRKKAFVSGSPRLSTWVALEVN
jgi:hypothetical protein